jgi:hypothetical protein
VTRGCKKFAATENYNFQYEYIPTESFANVRKTDNSTIFRMGIMAKNDGVLRFAGKLKPFDSDWGHELDISGWANTQSEARRQKRFGIGIHNENVKYFQTPRLLSEMHPVMFQIEFFDNGLVRLTKDGDKEAFMEFNDEKMKINFSFLSFSNWDCKANYFFDCPFESPVVSIASCIYPL